MHKPFEYLAFRNSEFQFLHRSMRAAAKPILLLSLVGCHGRKAGIEIGPGLNFLTDRAILRRCLPSIL
jgi:hypothetical protein